MSITRPYYSEPSMTRDSRGNPGLLRTASSFVAVELLLGLSTLAWAVPDQVTSVASGPSPTTLSLERRCLDCSGR